MELIINLILKLIINNEFKLISIANNFPQIIKDLRFFDNNQDILFSDHISIKDILIDKNDLYVSYTKEIDIDCYNTSILKAKINFKNLNFENFFTFQECLNLKKVAGFNGQRSGGRMVILEDKKMLLSVGEYGKMDLAQNDESFFSWKIILLKQKELNLIKNQFI